MIVINARFLTQKTTGVQRFAFELSCRLRKVSREQIVFVAPKGVIQKEMASRLKVITIGKLSGYAWEQIELPIWLLRHNSPKLLNLCSVAPIFYNNCYTAVHDITVIRFPQTFNWKFKLAYRLLMPLICRKSNRLITVSNFSLKELSSYYDVPQEKFIVAYNAASNFFKPIKDIELNRTKYFLAVSSVKENKNFIAALQAFEQIQYQLQDICMYVIGDCESSNFNSINIVDFKKNKHIKFLGRVSDEELVKYYSNAIGFVFPSLYEGFGIPVIEAQSCGCPVISSNSSSLPEVLRDSALFFEPNDINRLASHMVELSTNQSLRQELIKKGFENVKRFSWDESAQKIADLMNFEKMNNID